MAGMNIPPMVMNMLMNSPQAKNNPMAKQLIQILNSGDNAAGEEMAMNLCNTYGVSKEEAIQQAQQWAQGFPGFNGNQ